MLLSLGTCEELCASLWPCPVGFSVFPRKKIGASCLLKSCFKRQGHKWILSSRSLLEMQFHWTHTMFEVVAEVMNMFWSLRQYSHCPKSDSWYQNSILFICDFPAYFSVIMKNSSKNVTRGVTCITAFYFYNLKYRKIEAAFPIIIKWFFFILWSQQIQVSNWHLTNSS